MRHESPFTFVDSNGLTQLRSGQEVDFTISRRTSHYDHRFDRVRRGSEVRVRPLGGSDDIVAVAVLVRANGSSRRIRVKVAQPTPTDFPGPPV